MMKPVLRVDGSNAIATDGRPVIDWPKAFWNGGMLTVALVFCPLLFRWSAIGLFAVTTYTSLLVGHSVGMHRMMIHRSFQCAKPVERLLIYIGVLVGVAGSYGIIHIHDMRDWAQRQPACHDFFAHRRSLAQDLLWQLAWKFRFDRPPSLRIEPNLAGDPWYRFNARSIRKAVSGVIARRPPTISWMRCAATRSFSPEAVALRPRASRSSSRIWPDECCETRSSSC
jgi:stearoyl-CoA desaturase (delta-9 desaturase)